MLKAISCAAVAGMTLSISHDSEALGPLQAEAAAVVGGGTSPSSSGAAPNPLGFELGVRAGASISRVYLGLSFVYGFGGTDTVPCPGAPPSPCAVNSVTVSDHSARFGLDVGYDVVVLNGFTVRPELGLGDALFSSTQSPESTGQFAFPIAETHNFYLEPGVAVLVPLGLLLVGADANALWTPGLKIATAALTAHAQVGVRF